MASREWDPQVVAFRKWMWDVDGILADKLEGMTSSHLPDEDWWTWWESGMKPQEAADKCLSNNDFGSY